MVITGQACASPTLLCLMWSFVCTVYSSVGCSYCVLSPRASTVLPHSISFIIHRATMSNSEILSNADRGEEKDGHQDWMKELPHYATYALLTHSRLPHNILHSPYIILLCDYYYNEILADMKEPYSGF